MTLCFNCSWCMLECDKRWHMCFSKPQAWETESDASVVANDTCCRMCMIAQMCTKCLSNYHVHHIMLMSSTWCWCPKQYVLLNLFQNVFIVHPLLSLLCLYINCFNRNPSLWWSWLFFNVVLFWLGVSSSTCMGTIFGHNQQSSNYHSEIPTIKSKLMCKGIVHVWCSLRNCFLFYIMIFWICESLFVLLSSCLF